jgi:hypothetical protein
MSMYYILISWITLKIKVTRLVILLVCFFKSENLYGSKYSEG